MTFENITKDTVVNAAGRLVDPGYKIDMPVEYYAKHKEFIDAYVSAGKAKIGGKEEYEEFLKGEKADKKEDKNEKVDLLAEVQEEEKAKEEAVEKEEVKQKKDDTEKEEEKPAPKKTSRRRRATKTEE
jgi:hypothetical protein